ncbi:MAG: hypothetical protein HY001_04160 [Candidatus Portnoybacteria bacterium]|nr:hypothetical protein [Candidatus Portnoybacteria bacterium]
MTAVFFILFFLQFLIGFPFLPLLLFLQGMVLPLTQSLFFAVLTGISLGVMSTTPWYWIVLMVGSVFGIHLTKLYISYAASPPLLSLLLGILIGVWSLRGGVDGREIVVLYFLYSFLFFGYYAIFSKKTTSGQRRLF